MTRHLAHGVLRTSLSRSFYEGGTFAGWMLILLAMMLILTLGR